MDRDAERPPPPPPMGADGRPSKEETNKFIAHWTAIAMLIGVSEDAKEQKVSGHLFAQRFALAVFTWACYPEDKPLEAVYKKYYAPCYIDFEPPAVQPADTPQDSPAPAAVSNDGNHHQQQQQVNNFCVGGRGQVSINNAGQRGDQTPAQQRVGRRSGDCAASPEDYGMGPRGKPAKADVVNDCS